MSKVLVISGASKGIGFATAERFLEQGYSVINLSRSPCSLPGVSNLAIDLADPTWPGKHANKLLDQVGQAEQLVLVHNAAVMAKDSTRDLQAQALRDVLEVNVIAAAELNRLLLPHMKPGSSVLYIGSTLATKAVANTCSYVISKHALIGQMRASCQDLAGMQIHTACICPGFTDTEMLRTHLGDDPSVYASITSGVTQGRLITATEIAETVWFCSQNAVINGAVIDANLGQVEH